MRSVMFLACSVVALATAAPVTAAPVEFFSTGNVDGRMASASRPGTNLKIEIESADDFILAGSTSITGATFTGLLTGGATAADITQVVVEIYRVFPQDSDVGRTSGTPTFSTPQVPTRVNSPSDVAFASRDSAIAGELAFTTTTLASSFTASNSVQNGGIAALPNQTTGGDGPVTGSEVKFTVTFTTPFVLPADHYFFVPQVALSTTDDFLWLSSVRPIVAPGTPFAPDLQSWIRDENLDPDWLRIGTDIVGGNPAPTFNAAFSLIGEAAAVPEPTSLPLCGAVLAFLGLWRRRVREV